MDKYQAKQLITISCCIDDLNPELYPYVIDLLINSGANDAWLVPIIMKKGRPAVKLEVLAEVGKKDELVEIIFTETSTLGVRIQPHERLELMREERVLTVEGEKIRVKLAYLDTGKVVNIKPEFDNCQVAANRLGVPLKEFMQKVHYLIQKEILG